jgi:(1->4)-alpha-D-glucan 1-alpha-D-glucosylmutase
MPELRCTYRLQLLPHLDFARARELVPYLRELGVSHLYLSPALQARSESTHGYDVVDPTHVSEQLGGEEGLRELAAAGLGVILDVVPNHMAASDENPFWRDPLWRAKFFDVEWRTGATRRFFDIGDLAGVRMEDPEVFEATHSKIIELVRDGVLDGIRIDHIDGLANPARYLHRLRESGIERVWVEKILEPGEQLRDWPVEGTTGYEFAHESTALFVNPDAEETIDAAYGETTSFAEIAAEAKLEQARTTFEPEVEWLHARLDDVDVDIAAALASFQVYRSYVDPDTGEVDELDRRAVAHLPERLRSILLLEERGHDAFVIRFQQTTPPVVAKGVEDTAFYRYNRLLALNEVGGAPDRFSLSVDDFHAANLERQRRFPHHLLATQTHDTKRSGDVRARLVALSWRADEWRSLLTKWRAASSDDALVYQTLLGAWPIEPARLDAYLEKALREAKVNTNWLEPNEAYEDEVKAFARSLLDDRAFREAFDPFQERIAQLGERIALGQTLLKLTCPGVPDIYQGDELWNLSLVDPDNRRPVDWALRRRLLASAPSRESAKLHLIRRTLALRAEHPDAFAGTYEPVDAGPAVCAYLRGGQVLVAVPVRDGAQFEAPSGFEDVLGDGFGCRLCFRG